MRFRQLLVRAPPDGFAFRCAFRIGFIVEDYFSLQKPSALLILILIRLLGIMCQALTTAWFPRQMTCSWDVPEVYIIKCKDPTTARPTGQMGHCLTILWHLISISHIGILLFRLLLSENRSRVRRGTLDTGAQSDKRDFSKIWQGENVMLW